MVSLVAQCSYSRPVAKCSIYVRALRAAGGQRQAVLPRCSPCSPSVLQDASDTLEKDASDTPSGLRPLVLAPPQHSNAIKTPSTRTSTVTGENAIDAKQELRPKIHLLHARLVDRHVGLDVHERVGAARLLQELQGLQHGRPQVRTLPLPIKNLVADVLALRVK